MRALALCAGSYGTVLQSNYLIKTGVVDELFAIDDSKSFHEYSNKYLLCTPFYDEALGHMEGVIPSFALPALNKALGIEHCQLWQDKLSLELINEDIAVNTVCYSNASIVAGYDIITKPRFNSSGGRGIKAYFKGEVAGVNGNMVVQKFLKGREYVVDVVTSVDRKPLFTIRQTLGMDNGRDIKISFDIPEYVVNQAKKAIDAVLPLMPMMAFNIQMKEPENGLAPLILEVDTRLSGSSICNAAYNRLINKLFNRTSDHGYVAGEFNNECTSVYESAGLSVPSVV